MHVPAPSPTVPLWCPELGRSFPVSVTIPQAAVIAGESERSMYRRWSAGELSGTKPAGGDIRVATATLLRSLGLTVQPATA